MRRTVVGGVPRELNAEAVRHLWKGCQRVNSEISSGNRYRVICGCIRGGEVRFIHRRLE